MTSLEGKNQPGKKPVTGLLQTYCILLQYKPHTYRQADPALLLSRHLLDNYIEYLQAAFLIKKLSRVDINAKRLKKEQQFKLFLTNVSFRSAMFTPIEPTSDMFGGLVETAIFDQYLHRSYDIRYARWKEGRKTREIDFISIDRATQKPNWALEIKWSNNGDPSNLRSFMNANK